LGPQVGDEARTRERHGGLCCDADAADLCPDVEGSCSGSSVIGGGDVVSTKMEEIVDLIVGREEALGLAGCLEPLHLPLAPSGQLLGILGSVVQSLVLPVLDPRHDLLLRRAVAGKLIGDHDAWQSRLCRTGYRSCCVAAFMRSRLDEFCHVGLRHLIQPDVGDDRRLLTLLQLQQDVHRLLPHLKRPLPDQAGNRARLHRL
jgi:hypothetical protein